MHLDTLGEEELEGVARRLKRLIETLPARERARFIYHKDESVEPVIARHEALVADSAGPAAYLARQRTRFVHLPSSEEFIGCFACHLF